MKILINVTIILTLTQMSMPVLQNHREKRFLIVPPTAPTRHQLISGIGIPLDLEDIAVTSGWVIKAQYFLPVSVKDLQFSWLYDTQKVTQKRSVSDDAAYTNSTVYIDPESGIHVEKYEGKIKEIDLQSLDNHVDVEMDYSKDYVWRSKYVEDESIRNDHSRWSLYKAVESVLSDKNLNGRECLLRVICEAAAIKFGHENGILSELIHVMLSPSATKELYAHESDEEFDRAEEIGKVENLESCAEYYSNCRVSLIDIFSTIL